MKTIEVQRLLIALGYDLGRAGADGIAGFITEKAVKAFQTKVGLVVDGIAGPQTQTALKQAASPAQPGRAEPDKAAMSGAVPAEEASTGSGEGPPPPNASTLQLLGTARPIDEIIIHCAATPEGKDFSVADIRAWHKERGWSDIGYHYVVYRDGRVMLGRPVGQVGAHVANHNTGTIGICYIGGCTADMKHAKDSRTPAQRSSLLWLTRQLIARHKGVRKVSGHSEYANKACPAFDVRKDALGHLVGGRR